MTYLPDNTFDPTCYPVVVDCFGRAISAYRGTGSWYTCPFCGAPLTRYSFAHGNKCDNPACDARPDISPEAAIQRSHETAIEEGAERRAGAISYR